MSSGLLALFAARCATCVLRAVRRTCCVQWFSDPDLFIEVSAGSSYAKSSTKKNTVDPVWDETLLLWPEAPGEDVAATTLTVRVFDADLTGRQELGYGVVELGKDWSLLKNHPAKVRAGLLFTEDKAVHMYLTVNVITVLAISEWDFDESGEPVRSMQRTCLDRGHPLWDCTAAEYPCI